VAGSTGETEVADDQGGDLPSTRVEQAADDERVVTVAAGASPADSEGGEAEPVAPRRGEDSSAGPAATVAALAGLRRVGERASRGRSPAVVIAAVAAVVALIALAAWAAAGDGGGNGGDETGGGDASSTTTAANGAESEAGPTTASTTASTAATTTTAATGDLPDGWTRYEGPNGVYTIAHPAGWQAQPGERGRVRIRDPESGSYLLVDWTDDPRPDPVADWRTQSEGFAARHEGYQEIRIEPFRYRDYNAALWEFRYRDQGVELHVANLGFVAAGRGYALYFQTHDDRWASSQGIFDRFRQTFRPR
jgi:eukaryotic-like serine/threonine-protein kinase